MRGKVSSWCSGDSSSRCGVGYNVGYCNFNAGWNVGCSVLHDLFGSKAGNDGQVGVIGKA